MNRELFDGRKDDVGGKQGASGSKRYENWFDDQYKPQKRRIVLGVSDPILHHKASSKEQKYFGDPSSFKGSVKKTPFSQRNSNIFCTDQTQLSWKPTVKKVADPSRHQPSQKNHMILTDYTQRYKRNPLVQSCSEVRMGGVGGGRGGVSRNPIVEGEERQMLQRKGRKYRPDL